MPKQHKTIGERVKNMVRNWLQIQPAPQSNVMIMETRSFLTKVIECKLWYHGDAAELQQFYQQVPVDSAGRSRFWSLVPNDAKVRKIHSGLPALIIDTLAYIVTSDMDSIRLSSDEAQTKWEEICTELDFNECIRSGVVGALTSSDGAWKISHDCTISNYPMVEFFPADRVDYVVKYGKVMGVDFYTNYPCNHKIYRLKEEYRRGKITYSLYNEDKQVPLSSVPELKDLEKHNPVEFDGDYLMAVPLIIYDNQRYPTRGKSILESKTDDFDAFDEIVSQWMDAVRAGRPQKYIPEPMIPRNELDGSLRPANPFCNEYISTMEPIRESVTEPAKVQVVQPEIRYEALDAAYTTTLDLCLQGIISPATLGIDIGKQQSAEAQREKKDVTGHTRNIITGKLERVLPELISAILKTYDNMHGKQPGEYSPDVSFGEYGAPDFGSRTETINKAAAGSIMSIETQVEELWGSSKTDAWKKAEVIRIKQMRGVEIVEEPRIGEEVDA